MKLLFDENLPPALVGLLATHADVVRRFETSNDTILEIA